MAILIYQGLNRPGPDRMSNNYDLFNESILLVCIQLMMLFTDFLSLDMQFYMGWVWIGFVLMTLFINLTYIFYLSLRQFWLVLKKYCNLLKYYIYKKYPWIKRWLNQISDFFTPDGGYDDEDEFLQKELSRIRREGQEGFAAVARGNRMLGHYVKENAERIRKLNEQAEAAER